MLTMAGDAYSVDRLAGGVDPKVSGTPQKKVLQKFQTSRPVPEQAVSVTRGGGRGTALWLRGPDL